ncbi:M23 family metallopeptidase [Microbacterium sp. NRRL B-14842]|uniref:M23 family metallopeptidase n=1 Tax=Microbacterium sp. NRRL B-14842 TaxID=3162881 RepID=UPI003D2A13B7
MSYGYGMRSGRLHEGIDFVPGNGAPIQAIADGTVRIATEQGAAYGVTVYIDHVIDGSVITSHYSHMQYGSLQVKAGDKVKVWRHRGQDRQHRPLLRRAPALRAHRERDDHRPDAVAQEERRTHVSHLGGVTVSIS